MPGTQPLTRTTNYRAVRPVCRWTWFPLLTLIGGVWACGCQPTAGSAIPSPIAVTVSSLPATTPTPVFARPPAADETDAAPVERRVMLDVPVEAVYVPGQTRELYVFEIGQGVQRVAVELEAFDSSGPLRLKAQLNDSQGRPVARITASLGQPLLRDEWDLSGPGRYVVRVFGPETQPRAFKLTVASRAQPPMGGGRIQYGEGRSGEIAVRGQRDRWVFWGQAGDVVLITLTAPKADPYLELYAPAGSLVARNDDVTHLGRDSALRIALPADGEYTLVVRMYDDDQTGVYRLALDRLP